MEHDLQKAGLWKRISAGTFDLILTGILAVGFAFLLSALLGYDGYVQTINEANDKYGQMYGVDLNISQEEYLALPAEQQQLYVDAYDAMEADEEAVYAYNMMFKMFLLIITGGILIGILLMEFLIPLWLKNGQTLGKKAFGLCLMCTDGVQINTLQLFTRTFLGKFTIETMVSVYIILIFGISGLIGMTLVGGLVLVQILLCAFTRNSSLIHDLMAGTVVVDFASQRIFRSTEELVEHQKKIAAERAARQEY